MLCKYFLISFLVILIQFGDKACCYCYYVIVSRKKLWNLIKMPLAYWFMRLKPTKSINLECWSPQDATAAPEKLPGFRLGHNIFPKQNVVASDSLLHKNNNFTSVVSFVLAKYTLWNENFPKGRLSLKATTLTEVNKILHRAPRWRLACFHTKTTPSQTFCQHEESEQLHTTLHLKESAKTFFTLQKFSKCEGKSKNCCLQNLKAFDNQGVDAMVTVWLTSQKNPKS